VAGRMEISLWAAAQAHTARETHKMRMEVCNLII